MEEKRTSLTAAMDDIQVIRRILDQTVTSFRTLAPAFKRMGLAWLLCALVSGTITFLDITGYLFPDTIRVDVGAWAYQLETALQGALVVFLVVQCVLWQKRIRAGEFPALAGKILSIWQILLVLYLLLSVLVELSGLVTVPEEGFITGNDVMMFCMTFRAFLPVLFPAVPLLLTGSFLGDKVLGWLGAVVFLMALITTFGWFVPIQSIGQVVLAKFLLSSVLGIVRCFFEPVALLLMAFRLKRRPEEA